MGQIRQLEHVLLHAETTVPSDDGVVAAGKVVTYKFEGDAPESLLLGARENEEYVDGLTVYSPQAPLGDVDIDIVLETRGPTHSADVVAVLNAAGHHVEGWPV